MKLYLQGNQISNKQAEELFGTERLEEMKAEAIEMFQEDPLTCISWFTGHGMLEIKVA